MDRRLIFNSNFNQTLNFSQRRWLLFVGIIYCENTQSFTRTYRRATFDFHPHLINENLLKVFSLAASISYISRKKVKNLSSTILESEWRHFFIITISHIAELEICSISLTHSKRHSAVWQVQGGLAGESFDCQLKFDRSANDDDGNMCVEYWTRRQRTWARSTAPCGGSFARPSYITIFSFSFPTDICQQVQTSANESNEQNFSALFLSWWRIYECAICTNSTHIACPVRTFHTGHSLNFCLSIMLNNAVKSPPIQQHWLRRRRTLTQYAILSVLHTYTGKSSGSLASSNSHSLTTPHRTHIKNS